MIFRYNISALSVIIFTLFQGCQMNPDSETTGLITSKELYLPDTVWMVPNNNDYGNDTCEYSFMRMKESEHAALFWAKEFGVDPFANPDSSKRFNVDSLLREFDRIYSYYIDTLKFVEKGNSIMDQYKILIYIYGGEGGTAFGGGEDEKVGIFWAPPSRMSKAPFGALAHELGHSFQYLLGVDKARTDSTSAAKGHGYHSLYEMTSQYMLWQVYPEWMTFENYHLVDFMKQTHLALFHEKNMYHSPYVLEYWSNKHGREFIGKLWRSARNDEDPISTYKRITGIDQATFNDEIFDAARRFITWDMKRIEKVSRPYANQHSCKLNPVANDWFQIDETRCPQNYGYNGIQLKVPAPNSRIKLEFNGIAGSDGFRAIDTEKAGWRYGFLAVKKDGSRVYGAVFSDSSGEATFQVPEDVEYLWLVVCGAPSEHSKHLIDGDDKNDEQWPYQIKLSGTTLMETAI